MNKVLEDLYRNHRFCGRCGGRMHIDEEALSIVCPDCGYQVYAQIKVAENMAEGFESGTDAASAGRGSAEAETDEVSVNNYTAEDLWITEENGSGVTVCAYAGTEMLEGEVTIPDSFAGRPVTALGSRLFYECKYISSVKIPETVMSIGDACFAICNRLNRINFPPGLEIISADCFNECGFTELFIPDTVKRIRRGAFVNNRSLKELRLPSGLQKIEIMTFAGCSSLAGIEIPDGVTAIEGGAFSSCASIEDISFPAGITEIGAMAFLACTSLKKVKVPSQACIGDMAFPDGTQIAD